MPYLREIVLGIGSFTALEDNDDFFAFGMDSLQMLEFSRGLKSAFRKHPLRVKKISLSLIYGNPTLQNLYNAITILLCFSKMEPAGEMDFENSMRSS